MAEITIRRRGELVRGVFGILQRFPDGLQAKDVLAQLEKEVPPTPFEASEYPSRPNVRRYEKTVRFSTIPFVKAGWLLKSKGLWSLSEEGLAAFDRLQDAEDFLREAVRLYRAWKLDQAPTTEDPEDDPPASTTLEEAEESAWTEVEEHLFNMNPLDFQDLVAGLLQAMDYHIAWVAPPGPDRGIDIIAHRDPLGFEGPRLKVQVKRRADKIPVEAVRSFMATLGDGDIGLFVAAGGFTKGAETEARTQERRQLTLLDLKKFFDLWVEHYAAIPEDKRGLMPLRPVQFLVSHD
ncbi:MAG: restriction endonuclease [Candidatus Eisenbacteria sp.]|nr:restriction endonuclease [Candidatus Eisenbacteria bacterium]